MGRGRHNSQTYAATAAEIQSLGVAATFKGEERVRSGEGIHWLVDPRSKGGRRPSWNGYVQLPNGLWHLPDGIALPMVNLSDVTGSMENYIDDIFKALPGIQKYVVQGAKSPLRRYQTQLATGVITDIYYHRMNEAWLPLQFSQFEGDNRIDEQMQLLVPPRCSNDTNVEDYQFALFYLARQIEATIWHYGLKGYAFIIGDEIGRDLVTPEDARQFIGVETGDRVATTRLCDEMLEKWHFAYLCVNDDSETIRWWGDRIGRERVIRLRHPEDIPYVEAVFCGLTEGTIDLSNAEAYLTETADIGQSRAKDIVERVSHIPLRAQADLPGFNRIPLAGSVFAAEGDLWPVQDEEAAQALPKPDKVEVDWAL